MSVRSSKSNTTSKATVSAWLTTPDQTNLLTRQPDIAWTRNEKASGSTILADEQQSYQHMVGFGASFTDSSVWLVQQKLSVKKRTDLMNKLFHPCTGIGLSFLRQPLGASDFTTCGNYSYDEMPAGQTDTMLANFSIEHDRVSILPLLKQALHINPSMHIMATPWSPPGWMKSSDSMIGGTLNANAYEAYANYLVKCIQAYAVEGVPLYAITPQYEPVLAPWHIRSKNSSFSKNGCAKEPAQVYTAVIPSEQHTAVGKETGETAHIERWKNTRRQPLARFVRMT